jgi:hypothetical protein
MVLDFTSDTATNSRSYQDESRVVAMPYVPKKSRRLVDRAAAEAAGRQVVQPSLKEIVTLGACAAMRSVDQQTVDALEAKMDALFDEALEPTNNTHVSDAKLNYQ